MSNPFAADIRIEPTPSRVIAQLLFLVHAAAIAVVWLMPWPWGAGLALSGLVLGAWLRALLLHVWRLAGSAVVRVVVRADGSWELGLRDGRAESARLLDSSFVHPWLVVLNFAVGRWRRRHVLLPADSVNADTLRRLRVRLRMG